MSRSTRQTGQAPAPQGLVSSAPGESPWERHPDADELTYMLEGEVEAIVMTEDGPVRRTVREGSVFVVPRGSWHKFASKSPVVQFGATSGRTEHSTAEDPRKV